MTLGRHYGPRPNCNGDPLFFAKYHALGNSYIVVPDWPGGAIPEPTHIAQLCSTRLGIGSDGLLLGPLPSSVADFRLRIFNPDGSEAEKSGNGLRIFCRFLWDRGLVSDAPFTIETAGGVVTGQVLRPGREIKVAMGKVSFSSADIPIAGPVREVLLEEIAVDDTSFRFCGVTIGNPHCVIPVEQPSEEQARRYGPLIERHPLFRNRTNVQFMKVMDRHNIQIEIWERGAGYTFASGSSSCAAAAAAHKLGLCESTITVHMRGGAIRIAIDPQLNVVMTGPVVHVCQGEVADEFLA